MPQQNVWRQKLDNDTTAKEIFVYFYRDELLQQNIKYDSRPLNPTVIMGLVKTGWDFSKTLYGEEVPEFVDVDQTKTKADIFVRFSGMYIL